MPSALRRLTVGDLFDRYIKDVSPMKRGARWEILRLARLLADPIGDIKLTDLTAAHMADWRDRRLKSVTGATVGREMTLINHVFRLAMREWQWLSANPLADIQAPRKSPPRDRRITPAEITAILTATGHTPGTASTRLSAPPASPPSGGLKMIPNARSH